MQERPGSIFAQPFQFDAIRGQATERMDDAARIVDRHFEPIDPMLDPFA